MSVQSPADRNHATPRSARRRYAFYDLDGTLTRLNLLHASFFMMTNLGPWKDRLIYLSGLLAKLPQLYRAEHSDRLLLNKCLFQAFKGISRDRLAVLGEEYCDRVLLPNLYTQGLELLRRNRELGLEPVLVTGSPDFIVAALARRLDIPRYAANRLAFRGNLATGSLLEPIMAGESKARWCEDFAATQRTTLDGCWGYADSYYDLPFLDAVGHPVAVNPDARLKAAAFGRQWPVLRFNDRNGHLTRRR